MRFRMRATALLLAVAIGCKGNSVETPKDPVKELSPKPTSGPPPGLAK